MSIDYAKEQQRLDEFKPEDASLFWKPTVGQHSVKALGELEEAEPYEGKPQAQLKVAADGEEKLWTFSVGKSKASTYGQLVSLASKNNNVLKDKTFTLVVVNDGKKNSYTIVG